MIVPLSIGLQKYIGGFQNGITRINEWMIVALIKKGQALYLVNMIHMVTYLSCHYNIRVVNVWLCAERNFKE